MALVRRGVPAVLWWEPEGGAPRAMAGAGEAYPAAVFEQVHPAMGDRVRTWALEQLGDVQRPPGVGSLCRHRRDLARCSPPAAPASRVSRWMPARVRESERRGPEAGVKRHAGRAEDVARTLPAADLVVTNPPRTGMDARVTEAIAAAGPRKVAYISCDPATLARDLARLSPKLRVRRSRLAALRAFDLFPQTAHVETVAILEAKA